MYDIMSKFYKSYNAKTTAMLVVKRNNPNAPSLCNDKLKEYVNESLKKSIQKIEDTHKDPDYKTKLIVAKAFNDNKNNNNNNNNNIATFKLFAGATTISLSLYLVYSFMKRYRT
jgi:hypothetical protein